MNINLIPMTKENIEYLIGCKKQIESVDRKEFRIEQGHKKNDFKLLSEDKKHSFSVFMRINEKFRENFSIGLVYHPIIEKSIMLFRCNGPHNHKERPNSECHKSYHYHFEVEENITNGLNPMDHSEIVEEYATFREAFQFFIKHCNIKNADDFFYEYTELVLNFMEE
ncbi:hypothetical protein D4R71_06990 [bacterium]|nr:MAG: hypothetical protein D4R71_06990 [bacterium]